MADQTAKQKDAAKRRAKLRSRDIRMTVMRVVLPETGEVIGALVPDHDIDRRSMKERKLYVGKMVRATLREDRNPMFWRKAHVLGGWLANNVEQFEGLDLHTAVKRLQELSGIGCETVEYDIPNVGKLTRTEAQSLNFSDMDEGVFSCLWDGWIEWLRRNAWPHLSPTSREEVESLIENPKGGSHA